MAQKDYILNNDNRTAIIDLSLINNCFSWALEIAAYGDFNGAKIQISRKIEETVIPICMSWDNQTTLVYISQPAAGLTLTQIAKEGSLQFDLIGGVLPNVIITILGIGKS